jgi:hypothetical protein
MFTTISKAGLGMYIVLAIAVLHALGFGLDAGTTTEAVLAILNGVGAILWIVGQFLREDLGWGIFRKQDNE